MEILMVFYFFGCTIYATIKLIKWLYNKFKVTQNKPRFIFTLIGLFFLGSCVTFMVNESGKPTAAESRGYHDEELLKEVQKGLLGID